MSDFGGLCGHCDAVLDAGDDCQVCGYSGPPDTGDRTAASPYRAMNTAAGQHCEHQQFRSLCPWCSPLA